MATKRPTNVSPLTKSRKHYRGSLSALLSSENQRTSTLPSPIVRLHGHPGEVFTCEFHPDGEILLSGADRQIYIWTVFDKCENIMNLHGHQGLVMEAHFSADGENIFSCSADNTIAIWDTFTGARLRQLRGHSACVNSVNGTNKGVTMLCSGSDDGSVHIWDERKKDAVHKINTSYRVTSNTFNGTGNQVIYAGIDNDIAVWDFRKQELLYHLKGHTDSISGLSLSPDGSFLLSNSMDNSLRIWDISQSVYGERCFKTFIGNRHNAEQKLLRCAWSKDCSKIGAGSSDNNVYIWDTLSQRILYKLPGPKGNVNDVDFHPKEPILITAASDRTLYMGEIDE